MEFRKILRSLLFVPGSRPEFLSKAEAARPDAIILDLEDSVASHAKEKARGIVSEILSTRADHLTLVRINHPELGQVVQDLGVLAKNSSQAIVLPKVERVEDVLEIDSHLLAFEAANGLPQHAISVVVGIESAMGVRILYDALSCTPRARGAVLASAEEGDLMVDIGGRWTPGGEALAYCRGKFVCDGRAARAEWLLDGAFMNLEGTEALETETRLAKVYGFTGKVAIHPRQVATINAMFSPSAQEVERARRLVDAFREAERQGRGAVKFEGMMVDYANVRLAENILAIASD